MTGLGEFDFLKFDLAVGRSNESVVGVGVNEFCNRADVACIEAIDRFLLFAFEHVKRADFFGLFNACVEYVVTA